MKQKSRLGDRVRSQTDSQSACTANNLGQASDAKQQKIWYAISSLNLCDNFDIFYNSYTFWWFLHFLTILTFLDDFEFVCRFWQLLTIVYICLHIFTKYKVQSTKFDKVQSTKYKVWQFLTIFWHMFLCVTLWCGLNGSESTTIIFCLTRVELPGQQKRSQELRNCPMYLKSEL